MISTLIVIAVFAGQTPEKEPDFFKRWLEEDVLYIITSDEEKAARSLKTPEEKETFIQQFWERRDPTPGTFENGFRDEHYRRIAHANEKFTTGTVGWRTDRGKIYIRFGEPDNVERNASAGSTAMRTGVNRMTVPFEAWEYRNLPGIGSVKLTFVDRTMTGYYELTNNPEDKIAKFSNEDPRQYAGSFDNATTLGETPESQIFATRLRQYIAVQRPPEIRFKDLRAMVNVRLDYNLLPFDVRFDVLRGIGERSVVPITFRFDDAAIAFEESPDGPRGNINVYGAVTSVAGQIVAEFEDAVTLFGAPFYQRIVALEPGRYRLSAVVKDPKSGNAGTKDLLITAPRTSDRLSTSSLMLADVLEKALPNDRPLENFVIGQYRVRPLVRPEQLQNSRLGLYIEVYNFATDRTTGQPSLQASVDVFTRGASTALLTFPVTVEEMSSRYSDRLLIAKRIDISALPAGTYVFRLRVTDNIKHETETREATTTLK